MKRLKPTLVLLVLLGAALSPLHAGASTPWADAVVSHHAIDPVPGFTDPNKALGKPVGGGVYAADQSSVYSIGRPGAVPGSYITLKFNTPIENHPQNPDGFDFIVYTNAFWVGGNPNLKWSEPGLVEISKDVNGNGIPDDPWYVIPGSRNLSRSLLPEGIANPSPPLAGNVSNPNTNGTEYNWGYMGMSPTIQEHLDNYMRPDNPFTVGLTAGSGGGDAFDISWAVDDGGAAVNLDCVHFIRISAFINDYVFPFGYITPEIVAVAAVAPDIDSDGDGILDAYEIRVSGTDPYRPESTVLPLERPIEYGGSPSGYLLGTASDLAGNSIAFYSSGIRTGYRAYNCNVDILTHAPPSGVIPDGLVKSGACREFVSAQTDLQAAQIQNAEVTIAYTAVEIIGLNEGRLEPFRFDGASYTRAGISTISRNLVDNRLTFRTQYAGIFALASEPGVGDETPGLSVIALNALPDTATADGESDVVITSGAIMLPDESFAPEGMLFTVTIFPDTLLALITPDAAPETPGMQVAADTDSRVTFTARASTQSGQTAIRVASLDETTVGQIAYLLVAGDPAGPVSVQPLNPSTGAPGPIHFATDILQDVYGNTLENSRTITLVAEGGQCMNVDAAPETPGHQLSVSQGRLYFSILADTGDKTAETAQVWIRLYADAELSLLIADAFFLFDVIAMPMRWMSALGTILLLLGVTIRVIRNRRRSP